MAVTELPVDATEPAYDVDFIMSGVVYRLYLAWNTRGEYWAMSIGLTDGTMLAEGQPLRADWEVFRQVVSADMPPGRIICVDTSGAGLDPAFDDLGARVIVVYDDGE
jgi:hypothetical protein